MEFAFLLHRCEAVLREHLQEHEQKAALSSEIRKSEIILELFVIVLLFETFFGSFDEFKMHQLC